jgi:hypothetical protein
MHRKCGSQAGLLIDRDKLMLPANMKPGNGILEKRGHYADEEYDGNELKSPRPNQTSIRN